MDGTHPSVVVLGSTGSIGTQTIDVVTKRGWKVRALVAGRNVKEIEAQARRTVPELAVMADEAAAKDLRIRLADTPVKVLGGQEAVLEAAGQKADVTVAAIVGIAGLAPCLEAVRAGNRIALANKETMVCGGELVNRAAEANKVHICPVDSEHSAIYQCLQGGNVPRRILLTASGGPFFGKTREELASVTPAQALRHPNWSMGAKITVDSATMMNKALELLEATQLFHVGEDKIEILVHRQSIVHSMVEYDDGAVLAQLGVPDMRTAISYALTEPQRLSFGGEYLDFTALSALTFAKPDEETFPATRMARHVARVGGTAPAVFNGANEAAVALFLQGKLGFCDIDRLVEKAITQIPAVPADRLETVLAYDRLARETVAATVR